MSLNDQLGHVFFDVRIKKNVPDAPTMIGLYTSDIPPMPLTSTDTLTVTFVLEVNLGLTAERTTIVEASLAGSELHQAIEQQKAEQAITYINDAGEWQFQLLDKVWVLKYMVINAPTANLKKLVKDL